jgi:hypothetical protein
VSLTHASAPVYNFFNFMLIFHFYFIL